jgi:hypothetical protein
MMGLTWVVMMTGGHHGRRFGWKVLCEQQQESTPVTTIYTYHGLFHVRPPTHNPIRYFNRSPSIGPEGARM